jgi:hypothetical protein
MRKFITLAASAALLSSISVAGFAAEKSVEGKCKDQATKHHIAADKLDSYISSCVKKHTKKTATSTAPAPAAPAAPAATPGQ